MIANGQELLLKLPQQYPDIISEDAVWEVILAIKSGVSDLGQNILSVSLASIPAIITVLVYLILVPVMIFFFLKDKEIIVFWLTRFLPAERQLITEIWQEMDGQIGNYIRGKSNEILIIFAASFILFRLMDLNYASLLALTVGLSVLIPYIGAAVVTLPVALVAYFQWGMDSQFIIRLHRLPPVYDFPGLLADWFIPYPVKTVKPVFPGGPLHDRQWSGTLVEASATIS